MRTGTDRGGGAVLVDFSSDIKQVRHGECRIHGISKQLRLPEKSRTTFKIKRCITISVKVNQLKKSLLLVVRGRYMVCSSTLMVYLLSIKITFF